MSEGTASGFPGWYVEFQAALLRQAPRPGEINQDTAEGWTNNQQALKGVLAEGLLPKFEPQPVPAPVEKFTLLADLGVIVVPDGYDHTTRLNTFKAAHGSEFYYYNDAINDQNFAKKATVQLQPGRRLLVKAFKQCVSGNTTSKERLDFIATQKGVLTGAQGASLVYEQKRDQLPKGYWYCSFDEKKALPLIDGYHRVPYVVAYSDGGFKFYLGNFEDVWLDDDCLLVFCDLPADQAGEESSDS